MDRDIVLDLKQSITELNTHLVYIREKINKIEKRTEEIGKDNQCLGQELTGLKRDSIINRRLIFLLLSAIGAIALIMIGGGR